MCCFVPVVLYYIVSAVLYIYCIVLYCIVLFYILLSRTLFFLSINLLTIYCKYCNLIGYRIRYLSGDRQVMQYIWRSFPAFQTFRKRN